MKRVIIFFFLILTIDLIGQQQVRPDWPSLADTPWSVSVGDMQATGRSEFIGPRTGNVIWRKNMPLGILYGPVIGYDGVLYVGERALALSDSVNYFYALDKDGNSLWTFETESFYPNNVAPIIGKDTTIYFSSANGSIYALHSDGKLKWQLKNIIYAKAKFIPIAKNGDLYIPSIDTLYIISPQGEVKIKKPIPLLNSHEISFSVDGNRIFFITDGNEEISSALNAADLNGNILWSYLFKHKEGTLTIDNQNRIYVFGSNERFIESLFCFDSEGNIVWQYDVCSYSNSSSPTIDKNGNIIFHANFCDSLQFFSTITSLDHDGNVNWITPLTIEAEYSDNYINHGLVSDAEGKIYFGTTHGTYFGCIDSMGNILWTIDLEGNEFDGSPVIGADGTLYIGTHISSLFTNHTRNLIAVKDKPVSVENEEIITDYVLYQNYPNPFNPITNIKFSIPAAGHVIISVFDILGREIKTLVNEHKSPGNYEVEFNAEDFSSGIYFYSLNTKNYTQVKKMILQK